MSTRNSDPNCLVSYPRNLGYLVSQLSGYHRNTFRIESTTAQVAQAGRVITVNLPENAVIDLKSFRWVINDAVSSYQIDSAITGPGGGVKAVLPFGQALISRLEVLVNGIQITQGCIEYNTAFRLLRNARVTTSKAQTIDTALQNGFLDTTPSTATFAGATVGQDIQMIIQDWLGFMEAPSTRFIDTGLIGMITVRITLADNNVLTPMYLSGAPGATTITTTTTTPAIAATTVTLAQNMSYSLNNFYFTIDSISINDGLYSDCLREKLARDGFISINFDEYYSFIQDGNTSNTCAVRFAVSAQSINKLYGTLRPTTYVTRAQNAIQCNSFFGESLQPAYFNFKSFANDNNFKWNYSINNVYHPQYLATELEGLAQLIIAENKVGLEPTGNLISTFNEYRNNKFCLGIRLNHPIDGEVRNSFISGFDSRGTNAQLVLQMQGLNNAVGSGSIAPYAAYVLVNTTNTLRVGLGRAVQLIN